MTMSNALLEVSDLRKHFPIRRGLFRKKVGYVRAVDGMSFSIKERETLGLVGESGCGKTTLGKCILRLIEPTSGKIMWDDQNLLDLNKRDMRKMRREMQAVYQDPYSSLDPYMSVAAIIREPLKIHHITCNKEKIIELLTNVGLDESYLHSYPRKLSGGEKQRVGIARAIALNPRFIVLDEAVAALDVSVKAKILNLLMDLQEELGLTYLFISHDLGIVYNICDGICVMYVGKLVEQGPIDKIFDSPKHPYTKALLSANPTLDSRERKKIILKGDVPSPSNPPKGCRFHTRCPNTKPICTKEEPTLIDIENQHKVACHLFERK